MAGLFNIYTYGDCDCYGPCSGNCYYEDDIIVIPTASQSKSCFDKYKNIFGRKVPDTFCKRLESYNTNNEKLQEFQELQKLQQIQYVVTNKWIPSKKYKVGNSTFYSTPEKPKRKLETTKL